MLRMFPVRFEYSDSENIQMFNYGRYIVPGGGSVFLGRSKQEVMDCSKDLHSRAYHE